jgi:hypothetical protein
LAERLVVVPTIFVDHDIAVAIVAITVVAVIETVPEFAVTLVKAEAGSVIAITVVYMIASHIDLAGIRQSRNTSRNRRRGRQSINELSHHSLSSVNEGDNKRRRPRLPELTRNFLECIFIMLALI